MKEPPLIEQIFALAAAGLGYEDIAVRLRLDPRHTRQFVIGGRFDGYVSGVRKQAADDGR